MKRLGILALVLCLLGAFALPVLAFAEEGAPVTAAPDGGSAGAAAPEGFTPIASAADMEKLRQDPSGSFVLTQDIDMSGVDWVPAAFSGQLSGQGHTIYNLKVTRFGDAHADTLDGNAKVYDTIFVGLFSTLTGSVDGLNLRGLDIDVSSEQHCFAGALAGYIKGAVITNCTIKDARVSITPAIKPDDSGRKSCNSGVGGIAGFGSGTISGCTADTVLVFTDQCDPSLKVEEFLSGAVSCGNPTLESCDIIVDGYCSCNGYVHNGGLVGMYYVFDKSEEVGYINNTYIGGMITFYENNRDRRAYCKAYVGEMMNWPHITGCGESFTRNEIKDYSKVLLPEKCDAPAVTDSVVAGDCENWGYTTHTCSGCGRTWTDTFTPKVHVASDWTVVSEPSGGVDGLRRKTCTNCGELLAEEAIPALKSVALDKAELALNYKDTAGLAVAVSPEDAVNRDLVWSSSNEDVATVDQEGNITATGRGEAVITCSSADGFASSSCSVSVDYTVGQWLIKILLFGWIWY